MTTADDVDVSYCPGDDLRHRPALGERMRDSLFWELIMPEEELGMQIYLYLTDRGRTGYNVSVWGPASEPVVLVLDNGTVDDAMDLDDFSFNGLRLMQPELRRTANVRFRSDAVNIDFEFTALHEAFSYRSNPDGLPAWFAVNRFEQTGHVTGFVEAGGRKVEWDRTGHRDHSWGVRNWGVPHHWKWFVAYTPSGRVVNGWIWIAKGEWGFAGYVLRDGVPVPVRRIDHHADFNRDMTQRSLRAMLVDVEGGSTDLTLESFGVIKLPGNDRFGTEIWEAACRATIDGEPGAGQFETHWPTAYLHHLVESGA